MAGSPRLFRLAAHGQGALELICGGVVESGRFVVADESGAAFEPAGLVEVFGRGIALELLDAADNATPPWRLLDGGGNLALDLDPGGEGEAWLVPGGAAAVHRDPLTGWTTPLRAGARYLCRVAASDARVELVMRGAGGAELERLPLGEGAIEFEAPWGVAGLEIGVRSRSGEPVGVGRPSLHEVDAGARPPLSVLHRRFLEALRAVPAGDLARVRLPLPERLLDGAAHRLSVMLDGAALGGVDFHYAPDVQIARKGIERASLVRLVGRLADPVRRYLELQFWIDGRPGPTQTVKSAANGRFDARLPIPREDLDGRLHRIEVREATTQAVLFQANAPTAAYLARWPTLQLWAQPPMSPESAPAAPHHLRALQMWAARAARGEAVPPLEDLHQTLLGGVRRRMSWPPIAFPQVKAPRVSVVMPAHGKFEVTYLGLAALRFAPNETGFEVIVVDDGSTDETARIEDIVSGVRVVRHESAQGFVAACNAGATAAKGKLIVFLNNDTEVTAGWLDELAAAFDRFPDVGLAGAKLIYPDGRLQEAGGIVWGTGDPWNAGRGGEPDDPAWNYPREADYLSGAAIMVRRDVWDEVGGFGAEWAPAYFEDTDLAFKVRAAGKRVVYVPTAEVYHFEGGTAGVDKAEGVKRFQELNRPKFKAKWKDAYAGHGPMVGARPDLEKDRVAMRLMLVLEGYPAEDVPPDLSAQLRELQGLGAKITILPLDLTWGPAVAALQAMGVECLFAPWVEDPVAKLIAAAPDLAAILAAPGVPTEWLASLAGSSAPVFAAGPGVAAHLGGLKAS
jgi:GT2 family glycosyltransferase